jgi:hypothetical protein
MPTSFSAPAPDVARLMLAGLVSCALLAAQKPPKPDAFDPSVDPFTRNDPATLRKLGYAAVGSFLWVGDATTADVQQVLGEDAAIFIETDHFKLASTLRSFPWPREKEWRASLTEEIGRLAALCPEFDVQPKSIGPWLRAHLFAQRLERVYADFCARLRIDESKFPQERGGERTPHYMGEGPHLGQSGKYLVVLTHKALSAGTYARALQGATAGDTSRHNHFEAGSLSFVTSSEFAEKQLMDDRKLHCHVVYGVVRNLLDGYKFFWHPLPSWLAEGIPLWFSRQVDDEFLNFSGKEDAGSGVPRAHEWRRRVRLRVEHDVWPRAEDLCTVMDVGQLDYVSHMMAWSRVDFLLATAPDELGALLARLKAPITTEPRLPRHDEILERQAAAWREAFGQDFAAFDAAWVAWVKEKYPRR